MGSSMETWGWRGAAASVPAHSTALGKAWHVQTRNGALDGLGTSISSTAPALRHLGTSALLLGLAPAPTGGSSASNICRSNLEKVGEELEKDGEAQKLM